MVLLAQKFPKGKEAKNDSTEAKNNLFMGLPQEFSIIRNFAVIDPQGNLYAVLWIFRPASILLIGRGFNKFFGPDV